MRLCHQCAHRGVTKLIWQWARDRISCLVMSFFQNESKQHRYHGNCGEFFRRHRDQHWQTRYEWTVAFCAQTGTNQDAHRCSAETARELDMWSLATRGMHEAAQVPSGFCILHWDKTKAVQVAGLALKSLHLAV